MYEVFLFIRLGVLCVYIKNVSLFSFQEMLRFTGDNTLVSKELKAALDTMLGVLKHVNDIMHQVGITGFQVRNMFIVQHPMQFCGSCNKAPL